MERGAPGHPLSWLILVVAGVLAASALTLPWQPYTGVLLSGDAAVEVMPGGPGDRAGIEIRDRLRGVRPEHPADALSGPLSRAAVDVPLRLVRDRGGELAEVVIVPSRLTPDERRWRALLIAVASGFVLIGGWVWSERRDRLTRPFLLLTLALAVMLAPHPPLHWIALLVFDVLYGAITLLIPALAIHFFALFPEPRAPRGRVAAGVTLGYGVATILFAASVAALGLRAIEPASGAVVYHVLLASAAVWFATGTVTALLLFVRSYRRAGSLDARRRLRVALAGSVLGFGPLAALIVVRNLSPETQLPGERWAVLGSLLVPLSFAWATAVHRIFDFRVALKGAAWALAFLVAGAAAVIGGEWLSATGLARGADWTGVSLAVVAVGAALAGPVRPWIGSLGARLRPGSRRSMEVTLARAVRRQDSSAGLLTAASDALVEALRLDRCVAVELDRGAWRPLEGAPPIELTTRLPAILATLEGPIAGDDDRLPPGDRAALETAGFQWILPIQGGGAPALPAHLAAQDVIGAALLLGRRLAGPWLDRAEVESLARFADHLGVALENLALRHAARSHGVIDRELEQAGAIQAHRLPRRAPIYPTLDCAAAALSSEPVGGDYYDFIERTDREFTLAVGDAAGKGVPAALLLANVQSRFRHEAVAGREPGQVLRALNQELVHLDQPDRFVGLLCARVEVRSARVCVANAGLTPPLVRRRGGEYEEITASGLLLGVRADATYPDARFTLGEGDIALLYTDGLTEARRGEEMFGLERVREVLDRHAHRRAADILDALLEEVRAFARGAPRGSATPLDDLTVLVLKQLVGPPGDVSVQPATAATADSRKALKMRLASADTQG